MYNINISILFLISSYALILYLISSIVVKKINRKLLILFSIVSITIYSGVGISFEEIDNRYLIHFFIFLTVMIISMLITFKTSISKQNIGYTSNLDLFCETNEIFFKILSIIFILTLIIHLFVPTIRISQLWNPPPPTLIDYFDRAKVAKTGIILKLADFLNILLNPFFFIYIYILKKKNKKIKMFLWLFSWCYLDYLKIGYMGRYEMIILFIFITFIFSSNIKTEFKIKSRYILYISLIIIFLIPFFLWYENFRIGASLSNTSLTESFKQLIFKESDYPKYYEYINRYMDGSISASKYLLWLIFLPIPSMILPFKPTLTVNTIFSEMILGISEGSRGYYILLPSLLGEAFLIYGKYLYWIHAIIIGVVIASICKYMEKHKCLTFNNIFYSIYILSIARGGSQGYLGYIINGTMPIVLSIIIINLINRKSRLTKK